MDDLEELESWHEDLRTWERFQDELEKINEENLYEMRDSQNRKLSLQQETSTRPCANRIENYLCNRKHPRDLVQNKAIQRWSNSGRLPL